MQKYINIAACLRFIRNYDTILDGMYNFERISSIVRHEAELSYTAPVDITEKPIDRESRESLAKGVYALSLLPQVELSSPAELAMREYAVSSSQRILDLVEDKNHHQQLAEIDALTGTKSQREFKKQFSQFVEEASDTQKPLVYAFIDLDNFKQLNDRTGHANGDRLLAKVGETLLRITRSCDFVARDGGDEFKLLFPDYGNERSYSGTELLESMDRLGLKIRQIVNESIRSEPCIPQGMNVGASIGIGMLNLGENAEEFAERVERLMYEDKTRRRDFINR